MRMVDFPQMGWSMLLHIPEIKWWWWQTLEKYQNCKDWGKFGKTFLKVKPFVTFIDKLLHFHFCRRHEWNNEEYTNHPYVGIRQCRESSRTIHFALLQRWAHCRRNCRGTPATVCMISFKKSTGYCFVCFGRVCSQTYDPERKFQVWIEDLVLDENLESENLGDLTTSNEPLWLTPRSNSSLSRVRWTESMTIDKRRPFLEWGSLSAWVSLNKFWSCPTFMEIKLIFKSKV